jgi:hypothetical protein
MCQVNMQPPPVYTGQDVADAYQKGFREGIESVCRIHGLPRPDWDECAPAPGGQAEELAEALYYAAPYHPDVDTRYPWPEAPDMAKKNCRATAENLIRSGWRK